jgi:hypothetical protein
MKTRVMLAVLASAAAVSGCQTSQAFLDANQQGAIRTADARGRFDLNCQEIQTSVLSSKIINPAPMYGGIWRAEYTIGVRGCGRQAVYETICLDSNNCNAIADTGNVDQTY